MTRIFSVLALFMPIMCLAQPKVLNKVIAQVGGETVLLNEVEDNYLGQTRGMTNVPPDLRCQIFEGLLLQKLLTNQAKIDSVKVSDEQVENQLNARFDRVLAYMNNDMAQFEEYYGKSVNEMKDELREDLKDQMMADEMKNKVVDKITITPSEVKAYFKSIPYDSLPYYNSEVEYSELIYYPKPNKLERQRVIDKLNSIRTRIVENGEKFEDLAKKFSMDGSAAAGGDLGWAKRGAFVPEFEAVVFNLEEGQVSTIVETEFGFHLIQLLERRGNSFHARHILIKPELSSSDKEAALKMLDSIVLQIRTGKLSFPDAVKKFSNKNYPSYSNGGRAINPKTNTNFFEISDLEPDVYFALDTMKIGGMSAPIELKDPYGETAYQVLLLQARTDPHRASLEKDFSRIKESAMMYKKEAELDNWVTTKIRDTFITIDPEWLGKCPGIQKWVKAN
ncbi:MAG TPA: peptidylprolyl isomerase [Saprospiraceae bacterium]|nr:MAG: PpiC-type peptidyl-prolyl cis-trans isomerase [Candidatus Parvibacillus calidus]MCC7148717.1 peptidylprolyl isomerase [Saprospiraceae bacterium]WKZ61902.1 MAG: peptidylprolyl isomerase [Saprospiraceae bacterium]HRN34722.1 peptidylprolyl isomerase [Saprospiraceae bacterium]HRP83756.1 peptidylprolyl isomerase [Saprospiraceae bacterium]